MLNLDPTRKLKNEGFPSRVSGMLDSNNETGEFRVLKKLGPSTPVSNFQIFQEFNSWVADIFFNWIFLWWVKPYGAVHSNNTSSQRLSEREVEPRKKCGIYDSIEKFFSFHNTITFIQHSLFSNIYFYLVLREHLYSKLFVIPNS